MSERCFGKSNPVGREILFDKKPYLVKGVFVNNPHFHLRFDYIAPIAASGLTPEQLQSWTTYVYHNYVKLKKGTDARALELLFQKFTHPFIKDEHSVFLPRFQPLYGYTDQIDLSIPF